jgi:hypothetical protein
MLQNGFGSEKIRQNRVPGVRTVLVVLSSTGMVYDAFSLKAEIGLAYPEAKIFVQTTDGQAMGEPAPSKVDLLVDFTGPRERQGFFRARKLRSMARFAVGRAGSRKKSFNKVFDESVGGLPGEMLERERRVQREVLALAGVDFSPTAVPGPDRGKSIALELPPFQKL